MSTSKFSAGASLNGYLFQIQALLLELIVRGKITPEVKGYLEKFDDIEFEAVGDQPRNLVQSKFKGNPGNLGNSSVDLWKSIRIWLDHFNSESNDSVIYSLITNQTVATQTVAFYLGLNPADRNVVDAAKLLMEVATTSENDDLKDIFKNFRKLNLKKRQEFAEKIVIISNYPNLSGVENQIKNEFRTAVKEIHLDSLYERLEGWWIRLVIQHLKGENREAISAQMVFSKTRELVDSFRSDNLPIDFRDLLDESLPVDASQRKFVHQLNWISLKSERIRWALLDYYRAFEQRSKWMREDLLIDGELESYERKLGEEWQRQRDRLFESLSEETPPNDREELGRRLYDWMEDEANYRLRDRVSESYVLRGSYHSLADQGKVGWHPDFLDRLKKLLGESK